MILLSYDHPLNYYTYEYLDPSWTRYFECVVGRVSISAIWKISFLAVDSRCMGTFIYSAEWAHCKRSILCWAWAGCAALWSLFVVALGVVWSFVCCTMDYSGSLYRTYLFVDSCVKVIWSIRFDDGRRHLGRL